MSKDLDNTTILELFNDAARRHGMEELDSVENMSQEWFATMLESLVESLNDEDKDEIFPSQQPPTEVINDFHNLRIDKAVRPEYINWAIKYLGLGDTLLVNKNWEPVIGDVMAIGEAILKFKEEQGSTDE